MTQVTHSGSQKHLPQMILQDQEVIRLHKIKIQTLQVRQVRDLASDKQQVHNLLLLQAEGVAKLVQEMAKLQEVDKVKEMLQHQETMLQVMLVAQEVELLILHKIITVVTEEVAQEEIKTFAQCKNSKL